MYRYLIGVLFFAVSLYLFLFQIWQEREEDILARHLKVQEATYLTSFKMYSSNADMIYIELLNKPYILKIIDEANTASTERQAVLRGRLYRQLHELYARLAEQDFRQLHFHLADNSSLIRFHRLDRYGDSLTKSRESVRLVNSNHWAVSGFEIGKLYSGFRYVFPLAWQGKHIGSVETSISFSAIERS